MNDSIYRISLDIHEHGSQAALKAKKTDTGRKLHISLRSGGTSYIIADDCYAVFKATKPDGSILYNACTIENNEIIYEFTEQTCTAVGRSSCEIALYGLGDKLITSPRFALLVDGTVYPDGRVESTDEFSALTQMVSDTMEAKNAASKATSAANTAAENANKAAAAAKPGASIIPVGAAELDYLKAEHSLVLGNSYLITETDEQGIVMGYNKGDIFLATDKGSFEWQMNIIGEKGDKGEQGAQGIQGENGDKGDAYVLTPDDKEEIAGIVVDRVSLTEADAIDNAIGTTFPPSQRGADSRIDGSDINANLYVENDVLLPVDSATSDDIHAYIDGVINSHAERVTKETLGKDESGNFDICRYTVANRQYLAWCKQYYPKMYAWKNGSAMAYSPSISPRVGDKMYYTPHIQNTHTVVVPAKAALIKETRYSQSGGGFKEQPNGVVSAVIVPCRSTGESEVISIALTGCTVDDSYINVYYGSDKVTFPNTATTDAHSLYSNFTVSNVAEGDWYLVFMLEGQDSYSNCKITVNGEEVEIIETTDTTVAEFATTTEVEGGGVNVTATNATNRSRTVEGKEFFRYESGDVEPTVIYTDIDDERNTQATITQEGITYNRYPLGDLLANRVKPLPVFIYANEHGTRKKANIAAGDLETKLCAVVAARFVRDLGLEKQRENPLYKFMLDNCMLIVIPVVNPYGFNHYMTEYTMGEYDSYRNYNGVNINRNYDTPGWDVQGEGSCVGSENETQYVMNTMLESKSVVAMSLHGLGGMLGSCAHQGQSPDGTDYNREKLQKVNDMLVGNYGIRLRYYDYANGEPNVACNMPDTTSKSPSYITQCGAYGGIVEFQPVPAGGAMGEQVLSSKVAETAYAEMLNLLAMWLSDYLESK